MSFTCPQCGMTSQHPWDCFEGYCGHCHEFTGGPLRPHWYFDRQGQPISMERWGVLHEDMDYKRVALDTYPSLEDVDHPLDPEVIVTVSTVWLGINHAFGGGPPIIFETMVFGGEFDNEMTRYHSEAEAAEGHQRVVEDLRAGRAPWFIETVGSP